MSSVKWWRVVDPLNPLSGCDVMLGNDTSLGGSNFHPVVGLRRLDVLVGDRPFQLRAGEGQDLGVCVDGDHLVESPVQDDLIEIGYDLPHGRCIGEQVFSIDDTELRIADYEKATQVAYGEHDGELYATCTLKGDDRGDRLAKLLAFYESEDFDHYEFVARMKQEGR